MDARFDTSKDPRFKKVPRNVRKVQVDKRFAHMFHDKRFVESSSVDARGTKLRRDDGRRKLREFYALAEEKPPVGTDGEDKRFRMNKAQGRKGKAKADEEEGEEVEAEDDNEEAKEAAADEADGEASEDDEGEESEEEDDDDEDEEELLAAEKAVWEQADAAVPKGDATRRLAVMGCDWDHVTAGDLIVMFRSYLGGKEAAKGSGALRAGGSVDKVTVYPSDFGLEQIAKEAKEGPQIHNVPGADLSVRRKTTLEEDEEDEKQQTEAIRRYQLQRTKYYWALVECDSLATASWLYDQLDGLEAAGICPGSLDLRFIPDDLVPPHPPAGEATDIPRKYQAPALLSSAVGHTKVKCTWDEAPQQRKKDLMRKKFTPKEMIDMDLSTYLASSSGEEDGSGAEALKKLARGEDGADDSDFFNSGGSGDEAPKEQFGDMEATFSVKASQLEENLAERAKQIGNKVHTLENEEPKTVWEKFLEKRKEKRKDRRKKATAERIARKNGDGGADGDGEAEEAAGDRTAGADDLELLADAEEDDRGFNQRGPQRRAHKGDEGKKRKKRSAEGEASADSFKVDVDDPRIAAVFNSADFEIDPTNPEYRRTDAMGSLLKKKRQRKAERSAVRGSTEPPTPAGGAGTAAMAGSSPPATASGAGAEGAGAGAPRKPGGGLQLFAAKQKQPATPGGEGSGGAGAITSPAPRGAARGEAATAAAAAGGGGGRKRRRKASA